MRLQQLFSSGLWGWTQKLSGAFLDQALFAGSNFLINVLLARWMPADQYGAFVVAYAWFLLPLNFYEAILLEPLTIFGSGRYGQVFRRYLGYAYYGHVWISLGITLVLLIGAGLSYIFDSAIIAVAIFGMAGAAPFLLSRWLTRAPFYVLSKPHLAALGGFIYLVLSLGMVSTLFALGSLTAMTAAFSMGVAGVIGSYFLTRAYLKPELPAKRDEELNPRKLISEHWDYGKWSTSSKALIWFSTNIYYILLPMLVGLAGSAALRALVNMVLPMAMAVTAVMQILLPSFVRAYENSGKQGLIRRMMFASGGMLAVSITYAVVITFLGQWLVNLVYDGRFNEQATMLVLFTLGLGPVTASMNTVLDAALRAMGQVKLSFFAQVAPALVTLTLGLFLMWQFGLVGVNLGVIASGIATILVQLWFFVRYDDSETEKKKTDESHLPE